MKPGTDLGVHEALILLVLRDDEGTVEAGEMYVYALGGAIMAELLLRERIRVDKRKPREPGIINWFSHAFTEKNLIDVASDEPTGDGVLDGCLERIAGSKRRASLQTWVSRFASTRELRHDIARDLCARDVLREDEGKVLWFFSRRVYPEVDPGPERKLLDEMREAIFGEAPVIQPRTAILVSLCESAGLLGGIFGKKEIKGRKTRIVQITSGNLLGEATKGAIEAAQAAIVAACVVPAIVVTSS